MCRKSRDDDEVRPYLPAVEMDEWTVPLEGALRTAYMSMGRDLYHGLKSMVQSGDFNLFAHYHGEGDNSPDGRLMSIHMCMEMMLNHPDLVIESGMRYEANRGRARSTPTRCGRLACSMTSSTHLSSRC